MTPINKLIVPLFISDRCVEGMPHLSGPVTPPDAHERVQPIFRANTDDAAVIDVIATDLAISPDATDHDIFAILAELGYSAQGLIFESPANHGQTQRYHIVPSHDIDGTIELVPLAN